jgi:hypothetical protein
MAVPEDLRSHFGQREFVWSLGTSNKQDAVPRALALASRIKQRISELRRMSDDSPEQKSDLDKNAKLTSSSTSPTVTSNDSEQTASSESVEQTEPVSGTRQGVTRHQSLMDLVEATRQHMRFSAKEDAHIERLAELNIRHRQALQERDQRIQQLEEQNATLRLALDAVSNITTSPTPAAFPPPVTSPSPFLAEVIQDFLHRYPSEKRASMFAKIEPSLNAFLEVIGNRPVAELRQQHLVGFFKIVANLPPDWARQQKKRKLKLTQLAEENVAQKGLCLSPKTFEDTWLAAVRQFLKDARTHWQDQGFPTTLTTDGIKYSGDRTEGEDKQRPFTATELKRLFSGPEMAQFAKTPALAHQFWLPHIGLYTGARVREICQINPQTDVYQVNGIWFFLFSEETEAAEGVKKRVKNSQSQRRTPIHSKLLELGFIDYFEKVKATGAKLLFPKWPPKAGRASANPREWFSAFLEEIGLRDETPGKKLTGMHASRHTMEHFGFNLNIPENDVALITGRTRDGNRVQHGYQGEAWPEKLKSIIERITFEIEHIRPVPFDPTTLAANRRRRNRSRANRPSSNRKSN